MIAKLLRSAIFEAPKRLCLALSSLFGISASWSSPHNFQAEPAKDSFRGSFYQDMSKEFDTSEDGLVSPSIVFIESDGGRNYATYTPYLNYYIAWQM
jgi:hypothetical protein